MRWPARSLAVLGSILVMACMEVVGGGASTSTTSTSEDDGGTFVTEGTSSYISPPDGGSASCSLWVQDCPGGEKCMPYATEGTDWDSTRCVAVSPEPRQLYQQCHADGSPMSGIDDCDVGMLCWDVSSVTLEGFCIGFCQGGPSNPTCLDGCSRCMADDGNDVLPLCGPPCHPLEQVCRAGLGCYVVEEVAVCTEDVSEPGLGAAGDPCGEPGGCAPGFHCAEAARVPECIASDQCCTGLCDLSAGNPCPFSDIGQVCTSLFDGSDRCSPLDVGACLLP